ncbi:MAG: hypothetical protein ACKV2V_00775 [Blastocatellia bacterium]
MQFTQPRSGNFNIQTAFIIALMAALSFSCTVLISGTAEDQRILLLVGLTAIMLLPFFSGIEAGMTALMLFEPLRGIIRRAQYLLIPYQPSDPIHLLTPVITLIIIGLLLQLRGHRLFFATPLAKAVSILGFIFFAQVFNPLQGGLTVGLSGALYFIVPMAWFYFGQEVDKSFIYKTMRLMAGLGIVTSLYGVWQMVVGYPEFERYWIENTEFYDSIQVGAVKRGLATYCSAEEWGRYVQLGALVSMARASCARQLKERLFWLGGGLLLTVFLLLTGQRTSIFGLLAGVLILTLYGTRSLRQAFIRLALVGVIALAAMFIVKPESEDEILAKDEGQVASTLISHSTRGTLRPGEEGSLWARIETWTMMVTDTIPSNPLGLGLGIMTVGALRYTSGKPLPPVEGYLLALVIGCGLPTAILCFWILWRAAVFCGQMWIKARDDGADAELWRVLSMLVPIYILNNIFGNTFTMYSTAPIGWLILGWISAEMGRQRLAIQSNQ